jgi:hypothetical protein
VRSDLTLAKIAEVIRFITSKSILTQAEAIIRFDCQPAINKAIAIAMLTIQMRLSCSILHTSLKNILSHLHWQVPYQVSK